VSVAAPEDPRVRFAAERTLLAWIRTGLALMGFGFVVARFGLLMHEMAAIREAPPPTGYTQGLGVALVVLGVLVTLLAAAEHRQVVARIDRGEPYRPPRWSLGLVVAALLAALGIAMVGYLLQQ
jgi:putative membrane protein